MIMALVTLLTTAFTLLRNARSALAVADIGGTASLIPYYELAALPASILLSWCLASFLKKRSLPVVFYYTLAAFVLFLSGYIVFFYPFWKTHAAYWLASSSFLSHISFYLSVGSFFVVTELWKVALISILLWGFINNYMTLSYAKNTYAPLMLGTSLGGFLAGPLVELSTQWGPEVLHSIAIDAWHATLLFEMGIIACTSCIGGGLFFVLIRKMSVSSHPNFEKERIDLVKSFQATVGNPILSSLSFIVLTDYITYTLFEVLFLDTLKSSYPQPIDFNGIMGSLNQWAGALTAFAAIIVGPWAMRRCSWKTVALVTPVSVIALAGPYMLLVMMGLGHIELALILSCTCYCVCRATKYALLDSSKELAYLALNSTLRMQGKLIIEGIASRGGRALASLTTIGLITFSGGIAASATPLFVTFLSTAYLWTKMTLKMGDVLDSALVEETNN
jgi:AAA family ATP:ADP antiporter